ncbi:saccharopine dehydrogenase NADP-binding domain-containing protein [Roseomonas sp. CCTCC AB2023176]|uniref:saccharopine dehydrogenase NADP-binding domain-containing protein n=1 Tax=Roseomonas sp. CCTCC AB2023176 TaxID=3342640 RepID=UPI0035DB1C1F
MTAPTPRRVLVLGGTGAFGERLVRGLAREEFAVIVGARGLPRVEALAREVGAAAAQLDAEALTAEQFRALDAWAVVDASGPFVAGRWGVARAAIGAGAHYLDLADGRAFVAAFPAALDAEARAAGLVAVTGVSSTPALSCAALDALTAGWTGVDTVEVAILPGNRAPRGLAVIRSILSWAGKPVRVFLDGRWQERPGWGLTRRLRAEGLGPRLASLADTPDLDAVPARYGVRRSAVFRAGLEVPLMHLGLLVASLPLRVLPGLSLEPLARPVRAAASWLDGLGSDRGGMVAAATGRDAAGDPVAATWTLVAEAGDGPWVPSLPALAALRRLAQETVEPGARSAAGFLTLPEIEATFAPHRITSGIRVDRPAPVVPLFRRVLGEAAWAALPAPVRDVHAPRPGSRWKARRGWRAPQPSPPASSRASSASRPPRTAFPSAWRSRPTPPARPGAVTSAARASAAG